MKLRPRQSLYIVWGWPSSEMTQGDSDLDSITPAPGTTPILTLCISRKGRLGHFSGHSGEMTQSREVTGAPSIFSPGEYSFNADWGQRNIYLGATLWVGLLLEMLSEGSGQDGTLHHTLASHFSSAICKDIF